MCLINKANQWVNRYQSELLNGNASYHTSTPVRCAVVAVGSGGVKGGGEGSTGFGFESGVAEGTGINTSRNFVENDIVGAEFVHNPFHAVSGTDGDSFGFKGEGSPCAGTHVNGYGCSGSGISGNKQNTNGNQNGEEYSGQTLSKLSKTCNNFYYTLKT